MPTDAEYAAQVRAHFLRELTTAHENSYDVVIHTRTKRDYQGQVKSVSNALVELAYDRSHKISISLFTIEAVEVRYR